MNSISIPHQECFQPRVAQDTAVVLDHIAQGVFIADDNQHLFGTGHGGIEQVAVHQLRRAAEHRQNDAVEFIALAFVDGASVGKLQIADAVAVVGRDAIVKAHHEEQNYTFEIDGTEVVLSPDDVLVSTQQKEGLVSEQGGGVTVVLDTNLTPELREEGLMRELVSKLQTMRKEAGFEVADHIRIGYRNGGEAARVLEKYADGVKADTLAERIEEGVFGYTKDWDLNGNAITLSVERI